MRKFVLLAALLAMLTVAAIPALADRNNNDNHHHHHNNNNGGGGGDPVISQDNEQNADSGDLNQTSSITGGGDNSNQCVGQQITGNTGNAQNQTNILQYASEGEFGFDNSGSTIDVNPVNTTDCKQAVNQAATASG
jgi:hypothetical protein